MWNIELGMLNNEVREIDVPGIRYSLFNIRHQNNQ